MTNIERISISVDRELVRQFDEYAREQGFPTRSEALKILMRDALLKDEWMHGEHVAGTISLVYDHHKAGTVQKLLDVQHDYEDLILCSQHVHLDHDHCMEIIVVRGKNDRIKDILRLLRNVKGLRHIVLTLSTSGTLPHSL
ncbi:MAG: nickel-responsive transcriptional regulator NikR [Planctomycetia bacterium]|nr:nickel-responsive transcriptional regulator NikR [Planctomycetia bacterium]